MKYDFSTFSTMVVKSFASSIVGGMGISAQFGVYTDDNIEKTISFEFFCDETRTFFFDKSKDLIDKGGVIFSYFATTAIIKNEGQSKEILCMTFSDRAGNHSETTLELVRDYRNRITKTTMIHINNVLFKEYAEIAHRKIVAA